MIDIEIKSIPHFEQRYETPGDYFETVKGREIYRVSAMKDRRHEFLIAFHEIVENELRKIDGIKEEDITAFDMSFESKREQRLLKSKKGSKEQSEILSEEPGDDHDAPYYKHHQIATAFERLMASQIGVDWNKYSEEVNSL